MEKTVSILAVVNVLTGHVIDLTETVFVMENMVKYEIQSVLKIVL